MATPNRDEVEALFEKYLELGAYGHNWNAWADLFTDDAVYHEVQYGTFNGREAIREWIVSTMAGVPDMFFPPIKWRLVDGDQVCFCLDNAYPHPTDPQAAPIAFPSVTYLKYRDGLWCYEQDVYDVRASLAARETFRSLGGKAAAPPPPR